MFEVDMKEKATNTVEMSDVSPEVVSDLLTYIYTGQPPNVKTLAKDLMMLAHRYEIPRLFTTCEEQLISETELSNVIEMYYMGKLYASNKLVKASTKFMSSNLIALLKTPKWDSLTDCEGKNLLIEIIFSLKL